MAGFDGAHILVLVDMDETGTTPDWQTLAAQRGFSLEASRNMLDGSVKGSDHAASAYGRLESTASVEGLRSYEDDPAGTQQKILDAIKNREEVILRYQVAALATGGAAEIYEAPALISSMSMNAADNENTTFDLEFTLNASFELVAGP